MPIFFQNWQFLAEAHAKEKLLLPDSFCIVLARYANSDGVFVLVCSGSLEANGVKKLIEIVYNLLIEPIQLSSFVVLELGVRPVRLE